MKSEIYRYFQNWNELLCTSLLKGVCYIYYHCCVPMTTIQTTPTQIGIIMHDRLGTDFESVVSKSLH